MGGEGSGRPQGRRNKVLTAAQRYRDTHHMLARLCARGLKPREIARRAGYTVSRVYQFRNDPAFLELIEYYRSCVDQTWREEATDYYASSVKLRDMNQRMLLEEYEELDERGERPPIRTMLAVNADYADRTGFGKRQTNVNINVDFAAQLDRAIKRSQGSSNVIEFGPRPAAQLAPPGAREQELEVIDHQPIRQAPTPLAEGPGDCTDPPGRLGHFRRRF